jgi:hypothetical protein
VEGRFSEMRFSLTPIHRKFIAICCSEDLGFAE